MKTTNETIESCVDHGLIGGADGDEPHSRPGSSDGRKTVNADFDRFGPVNTCLTISSYA